MKIRIENFGPIHSFEMDLEKDMHILYGENSVGKSYAVMLVYLILKNLKEISSLSGRSESYDAYKQEAQMIIAEAKELLSGVRSDDIDLTDRFEALTTVSFKDSFSSFLNFSIENSLGNSDFIQNKYSTKPFNVQIFFKAGIIYFGHSKTKGLTVTRVELLSRYGITNSPSRKSTEVLRLLRAEIVSKTSYQTLCGLDISGRGIFPINEMTDEVSEAINLLYFLPASRSGLYVGMQSLTPMLAKLAQMRHLIREKIEIPGLTDPMSDYYLMLSSIKPASINNPFTDLAKRMEYEILQAELEFDDRRKALEVRDARIGLRFDLSQTSSMISELAPIIATVKYVMSQHFEGEYQRIVLFIEEPEAHLHPKIQIKLMEFFAELTKLGVKVIMTTHSNYIFNKASNMILKGELAEEKVANYHLIMTDQGSIVNPKDTLHAWGMEDENFVDVAEELLDERMIAIDAHNQK